VTIYVLMAGYPADALEQAFQILQTDKGRNLRSLPNLPSDLPDEYFTLLDNMLSYRYQSRKSAKNLLQYKFVLCHEELEKVNAYTGMEDNIVDIIEPEDEMPHVSNIKNVFLDATTKRHSIHIDYRTFERSVASLLARVLPGPIFDGLIINLGKFGHTNITQSSPLHAITVNELKAVLINMNQQKVNICINNLSGSSLYENFAFHISLLRVFSKKFKKERVSMILDDTSCCSMKSNITKPRFSVSRLFQMTKSVSNKECMDRSVSRKRRLSSGNIQRSSQHTVDAYKQ